MTCWVGRDPPRGALEDASGHRKFVTVLTHRTPPSAGLAPRVTPGRGRNEHKRSDALGVCDRRQDLISPFMSPLVPVQALRSPPAAPAPD